MKSSWQAIEFARAAFHARDDARRLYEKVQHLYVLIGKIELVLQDHDEPFDQEIVSFVQNVVEASNRTLDELASRCRKLGNREETTRISRVQGSIPFILSWPSIQKFEQQVQTSIISMQFAFYLLDRGANQNLERRISEILILLQGAIDRTANHSTSSQEDHETQPIGSSTTLELLENHTHAVADTIVERRLSPSSLARTCSISTDDHFSSPLELLRSQETCAWGEVRHASENSSTGTHITEPPNSTTLIVAIGEHSLVKFQQLLDEGVSINGTDDKGFTPLMHTICKHGGSCDDCMYYMHKLLQLRCDIDASADGVTALHMAVRYKSLNAARALLEKGTRIDSSSPDTPLLLAIKHNRPAFVDLLVTHGADVHVTDESGWGLIHHAVWQKSTEALVVLLEKNKTMDLRMDVDVRSAIGWTPLMLLAERAQLPHDVRLARLLLENKADINTVDDCGNPALYYALKLHAASPQRNNFVHFLVEEKKADKQLVQAKVMKLAMGRYPALRPRAKTQSV